MAHALQINTANSQKVSGEFVTFADERYYVVHNVDQMPAFFVSVISNEDHWLFASSTGGLTAGRVSPETALFPYVTVDKVHESSPHTGSKTVIRVDSSNGSQFWEPYNREQDALYSVSRNLYKNTLGNKLCFEEINHDLKLKFRYTWSTSDEYGFVRDCELENFGDADRSLEILDGLQNMLPAGTPLFTQTNVSNLVDAYKWTELDEASGLAFLTLYSGITDRAEPCESLKATTVFNLGLDKPTVLISSNQLMDFRQGKALTQEKHKRGLRGAYLVAAPLEIAAGASHAWRMVANTEQSQADAVALRKELTDPAGLSATITKTIAAGSERLARRMAASDGFQATAEENVTVHHYANTLFNVLRGGIFNDQYNVSSRDLRRTIRSFNKDVYGRSSDFLAGLPETVNLKELLELVAERNDPQLSRLCSEYLPITFGRRHGDPSRPWNKFAIVLQDEYGEGLLSYEGNWRDIFQNWEALMLSFPEYTESVIAKFVNASTADGYNPYRITKEGIDWEVEEPDNPWSYIGYWGDHQIIYLQKLLELSSDFHPSRLKEMLRENIYCYANVPYRIRPFDKLLADPKNTVDYADAVAEEIERRVAAMGADGKLIAGDDGVYLVNLLEKLIVPLLAKLGNLVVDGGIWLNTQRPEWNDANNALVGQGLSMVTLYYMRRYVHFLQGLLEDESDAFPISREVGKWLGETADALSGVRAQLSAGPIDESQRFDALTQLGQAASDYRETVYAQDGFSGTVDQSIEQVNKLLDDALATIDHSISVNRRDDGLYHAYNLLEQRNHSIAIDTLYPMLEGQVAALSAGVIEPGEAVEVLEALFESTVYRPGQNSFMLYPDRDLPDFLDKNRIDGDRISAIPLLDRMVADGDDRIVSVDAEGTRRFNPDLTNVGELDARLDMLAADYGDDVDGAREAIRELYEDVFNHKAFTGRSGTMFGFEGLGSIYWHMVSKLLLAVEENFFWALDAGADEAHVHRLGELYYRVRNGIGFNKTPEEYGAFPTDPYSHTPKHIGARQPGMTGQVKEEVITRFAELGVRISGGTVTFQPALLREQEFTADPVPFCYLDVDGQWHDVTIPPGGLAFTWCQIPITYRLDDPSEPTVTLIDSDGKRDTRPGLALTEAESAEIFARSGRIRGLDLTINREMLFNE